MHLLFFTDAQPGREIIENGENGLLVNFFNPQDIADRIEEGLDNPSEMKVIRNNARQTILERYDPAGLLPAHIDWLQNGKST